MVSADFETSGVEEGARERDRASRDTDAQRVAGAGHSAVHEDALRFDWSSL
ncbi:MAG: hypothetical protein PXZ08_00445 [Actinomycetota bacterium]|nr:hypothetical protein [Actinomycetota bacterium]